VKVKDKNKYVTAKLDDDKNLIITISKVNETTEISKNSKFFYNFAIDLYCEDKSVVNMYVSVGLIDSNNHQPIFDKPKYTYNLISTYMEDFKRQLFLNPITATDYDVTNAELKFTIETNKYFDITYSGVVPGTLNKKHYAQLVPKIPGSIINEKIEVSIIVTDMGNPPRRNVSKLVINPPSPPMPIFIKPFYIGHYYKNSTFKMIENPQLQEGTNYYETSNYLVYELKATYRDKVTKLSSTGIVTIIVELHHDLLHGATINDYNKYVHVELNNIGNLIITILQINEKTEISKECEYRYTFPIDLTCTDWSQVIMYTSVALIDSNNHTPFFDKSRYTYNLISTHMDVFKYQLSLNPIIATDYDVTNTELKFSIEENKYFDITYNGVVPNTLNKKHYAQLVPKLAGTPITDKIEVVLTVTDNGVMGNPPRQNVSRLVINPPSPPMPTFTKAFYEEHWYKNDVTHYRTSIAIINDELIPISENNESCYFRGSFLNGEFIIENVGWYQNFYETNYLVYELRATYTNEINQISTTG
ncbi:uncharacterized protein BDFB_007114, partial [Asbolus verrucosus]